MIENNENDYCTSYIPHPKERQLGFAVVQEILNGDLVPQ